MSDYQSPFQENEFPFKCLECGAQQFAQVNSIQEAQKLNCPRCGARMRCIVKSHILRQRLPDTRSAGCLPVLFLFALVGAVFAVLR